MLGWHEVPTEWSWHEILTDRHFRPSQNLKWITVKWLNSWRWLCDWKLKNPPFRDPFFFKRQACTHYCIFEWPSLAQQNYCDKILFSHTRRWYQFLFLSFSLPPCLPLSLFFSLSIFVHGFSFLCRANNNITRNLSSNNQLSKNCQVTAC